MNKLSKLSVIIFVLLGLSGLCIVSEALASDITIDDFNGPSFSEPYDSSGHLKASFSTGDTYSHTYTGLAGVLGGSRQIDFKQIDGYGGNSLDMLSGSGYLSLSQGCGGPSNLQMLYNASGAGLNADLLSGTDINVLWSPDHMGFIYPSIMSFTLTDKDGHYYTSTKTWDTPIFNWNEATQSFNDLTTSFALNDFSSHGVGLNNVNSILFAYNSDWGNDMEFNSIKVKTIPEPISSTLFLLGAGALGLRTFRKRKKA